MHAAHVAELLQTVCSEHAVSRRIAEEAKAAAGDLEGGQTLVAQVDVFLGLKLHLGRGLVGGLQVIKH